ncbi:hypothetical protein [Raoultibacter phocaeensis]|uniref:hypothetical protein n=1 Tax=Raoultibacter phocaeensis TaxID=2479841 RepID=UPI001119C0D7|nr:hypothetical protein [Raoultibacter phocaeensis]
MNIENVCASDAPGACERSVDEMFEHLEALCDALPRMEELGARVAKATCAREAVEADRRYRIVRTELDEFEAHAAEALALAEQARDAGRPKEDIELYERDRLYFAAMRGFKVGPSQNERAAVEEALKAGGFASIDEANDAVLPSDELSRLAGELEAYRADYAETLAACQEVEGQR